ncbi:hypothetical protein HPB48_014865 [Haemaphysalis longicornis]|uniref:Uncharacterized protein n=1 Tax=Haemaphysalis longicornis TaxID=44386 RepID=A0A9J6FQ01_HAELO|nr:hypothetical protein HPB48_014865 [Haemaphysalis longicornis]
MTFLSRQDTKIVMRPRGGRNVGEISRYEVSRTILTAAGVSPKNVIYDVICPNKQQNIIVVSTPRSQNADHYWAVKILNINGAAPKLAPMKRPPTAPSMASSEECRWHKSRDQRIHRPR